MLIIAVKRIVVKAALTTSYKGRDGKLKRKPVNDFEMGSVTYIPSVNYIGY